MIENSNFNLEYLPLHLHLEKWARQNPHKPAVIGDTESLSYHDLVSIISETANGLREYGVQPGDRVVVSLPSKVDFLCSVVAVMAIGAYAVPSAGYEEDLEGIIRNVDPKIVITSEKGCQHLQRLFLNSKSLTINLLRLPGTLTAFLPDQEHIAIFIHTSGTTSGKRLGTMLSHRSLSGTAQYMNLHMGVTDSIRELVISPLQHGFGMGRCRAVLHAGGTIVLQDGIFSPASALTAIEAEECNAFSSASSGIVLLLDHFEDTLKDLSEQILWVEMGTLPLSETHMKKLLSILRKARIFLSYGMTEAIRSTILEVNKNPDKLNTVGECTDATSVRVVDHENNLLPTGETGKIQVKGVNVASGYWRAELPWEEKFVNGWIESGDLGWIDKENFLHFVGREDDMINVGGLKVSPIEIEDALKPFLGGLPYTVTRVPDPEGVQGFVPGLFIESDNIPDLSLIRDYLRGQLAEFKIPKYVQAVEKLPRTLTTKKIRRGALAAKAEADYKIQQLSTIPSIVSHLFDRKHRYWPLLLGLRNHSYGELSKDVSRAGRRYETVKLNGDLSAIICSLREGRIIDVANNESSGPERTLKDTEEQPSKDTVAIRYKDGESYKHVLHRNLEITTDWITKEFHITRSSVTLIDLVNVDPELVIGFILASVQFGGSLVLVSSEKDAVPSILGAAYRYNASHFLIGENFLKKALFAEKYLDDSFSGTNLLHRLYSGPAINRELLAQFETRFGIKLQSIVRNTESWKIEKDEPTQFLQESNKIWNSVVSLASDIFMIKKDELRMDSGANNTQGWTSLSFVGLIASTEEYIGIKFRPRDIMRINTLGDLKALIEERLS